MTTPAHAHAAALRLLLALLRDDDAAEDELFDVAFELDRQDLSGTVNLILAGMLAAKIRRSEHRDAWREYYEQRLERALDDLIPPNPEPFPHIPPYSSDEG